jgi:hypothetical protein
MKYTVNSKLNGKYPKFQIPKPDRKESSLLLLKRQKAHIAAHRFTSSVIHLFGPIISQNHHLSFLLQQSIVLLNSHTFLLPLLSLYHSSTILKT